MTIIVYESYRFGRMSAAGDELKTDRNLGFPGKLFEVLKSGPTSGIVWSADGDAICIFPKRFNECESKQHFQGTLYGSFTRRLYRYGFDRLVISPSSKADYPHGAHIYRNDLFRRERPELVKTMKVDNKRLYRKAIRQKKPDPESKKEERSPSDETLTSEKAAAPPNHENALNATNSITNLLCQELWMQNQLKAAFRNVDNRLNRDPFLIAAFSRTHSSENSSGAEASDANAFQNVLASPSSQVTSFTGLNNSGSTDPSFLDSQILEMLRLQYWR